MRTIKVLFVALAVIFMFQACETKDGPDDVTEKFMNHLIAGEFDLAAEYGTESTKQMMEMFESLESLGGEGMVDEEIEPEKIGDIECEVDGDSAICRFDEDGEMAEVQLVKQDGVWLVDMKKENPFGDMDMDMDLNEEEIDPEVEVDVDVEDPQ
ncbi:MAG: hypothetical protein ABR597_11490 [Bacteroidales bacterium]